MVKVQRHQDRQISIDGSRWAVSDQGDLHVYEEKTADSKAQPIASFARGTWLSVQAIHDES